MCVSHVLITYHHHRNMYLVDQTALHYVVVRQLLPILQYKIEIHVVLFIKFYYFHFFMIGFKGCNRKFHSKKLSPIFFYYYKKWQSVWQIAVMLKFCLSSRKNKRVSSPFYFIIFSVKEVNLFLYILPKFRFLIQYNFFLSFQENSWKPGWSTL